MIQGEALLLSDGQKAVVIRGSESGLKHLSVVVLQNGFIRLIDIKRETLLYSLGELIANEMSTLSTLYRIEH